MESVDLHDARDEARVPREWSLVSRQLTTTRKGKGIYSISQLRSVTCHLGDFNDICLPRDLIPAVCMVVN